MTDAAIPVPAAGRYWLELTDGYNDARSAKPFRVSFGFRQLESVARSVMLARHLN